MAKRKFNNKQTIVKDTNSQVNKPINKPHIKVDDIRKFGLKQKMPNSLNSLNQTLKNFQDVIFDMLPELSSKQKDAITIYVKIIY